MGSEFIVIGHTILNRDKIIAIYRDKDGKMIVQLDGAEDHAFEGGDAVELWKLFDKESWRD